MTLVIYLFILVRGTLPRMRYDRLMSFGWKVLIPFGLVWVLVTGAIVVLPGARARPRDACSTWAAVAPRRDAAPVVPADRPHVETRGGADR